MGARRFRWLPAYRVGLGAYMVASAALTLALATVPTIRLMMLGVFWMDVVLWVAVTVFAVYELDETPKLDKDPEWDEP